MCTDSKDTYCTYHLKIKIKIFLLKGQTLGTLKVDILTVQTWPFSVKLQISPFCLIIVDHTVSSQNLTFFRWLKIQFLLFLQTCLTPQTKDINLNFWIIWVFFRKYSSKVLLWHSEFRPPREVPDSTFVSTCSSSLCFRSILPFSMEATRTY